MERHHVKRLPVLREGALVGIVSRADLMRALGRLLDKEPRLARSDNEIRQRVLAEMAGTGWAPRAGITVVVNDGVVELDGVIVNDNERVALRVAAENIPGVKAVRDRLVWVEPVSGTVIDAPGGEQAAVVS